MGKLRDWWPSDEVLELRLSEVVGALNATTTDAAVTTDAAAATTTTTTTSVLRNTACDDLSPPIRSAPIPPSSNHPRALYLKLTNSQDHKEELLRKLLTSNGSSDALQQAAAHKSSTDLQAAHKSTDLQQAPALGADPSKNDHRFSRSNPRIKGPKPSIKARQGAQARKEMDGLHEIHDRPINKESLTRREIHIYSERQRRKGMSHLYGTLQSLLPQANPKADRCTVLTEAMDYIHILQAQVEELGRQKTEILVSLGGQLNPKFGFGADAAAANPSLIREISDEIKEAVLLAADVAVRFCGKDAYITLTSPKNKGLWSGILQILHELDMELLNVTLSASNEMDYHCIHARMSTACDLRSHELQKIIQDLVLSHAILD